MFLDLFRVSTRIEKPREEDLPDTKALKLQLLVEDHQPYSYQAYS